MKQAKISLLLGLIGALFGCNSQAGEATPPFRIAATAALTYEGFAEPVRALHDAGRDRYLVSNVSGETTAADNDGFISLLSPDGSVIDLKWIAGGKGDVTLNAPKGLALGADVLYVADIDTVRRFDAETGAPLGEVVIPGATFLNGLSATAGGQVYVTDSGPPRGTLDARGTEAIYVVENASYRAITPGPLGRPTSVVATDDGAIVASFGAPEIRELDARGKIRSVSRAPAGGLAGVLRIGDWVYVTSWQASAIYEGQLGRPFTLARGELAAPTDLALDATRNRLLVPSFTENKLVVLALE